MSIESAEERAISLRGVPIIDVSPLIIASKYQTNNKEANNNNEEIQVKMDRVVKEISEACKNWGFYYAVGHGIDKNLIQALKDQSRKFINMPKEFKRKILRQENNFRGYFDNEFTKQTLDWKEGFDIACIDSDLEKSGLDGWTQWPEGMPKFKEAITKYFYAAAELAYELMVAMWKGLDGDMEYLEKHFGKSHASFFRVNYYGTCPTPEAHLGVGPHSDAGAITVLLQDDGVNSLQVQRNGVWYNVPPIPDSFVINTGDMCQVWSNGLYHAPVHRVLANKNKERYSFPFFYQPSYNTIYEPLPQLVTEPSSPARYKPIDWGHFRMQRFAGDYADLGEEIQISHYEINREKWFTK